MEVVESWVSSEFNCQPCMFSQTVRLSHARACARAEIRAWSYIHTPYARLSPALAVWQLGVAGSKWEKCYGAHVLLDVLSSFVKSSPHDSGGRLRVGWGWRGLLSSCPFPPMSAVNCRLFPRAETSPMINNESSRS